MNQEKEVHWWVLRQRDSYDAFVDAWNLEKYATTLAAESYIDACCRRGPGNMRVRGPPVLPRSGGQLVPPASCRLVQDGHRKVRLEAHFYTAIAWFLFSPPLSSGMSLTRRTVPAAQVLSRDWSTFWCSRE
jgi:hypothetical protein